MCVKNYSLQTSQWTVPYNLSFNTVYCPSYFPYYLQNYNKNIEFSSRKNFVDKYVSSAQAYVNNLNFLRRFKIICMDTNLDILS
jgi:hypothetical protein